MDILIVDDEQVICNFLKRFFSRKGHNPDSAQSAEQGFERLKKKKYDLILCDLRMPKMNGLEFFSKMSRQHPDMIDNIVFTSGDISNDENQNIIRRIGRPFLPKPISLDSLYKLISNYN